MSMKTRKLIENIMYDREKDSATLLLRSALRLLAIGYYGVTFWRNFLYDRRILKFRYAPCRVISVGNIIVGGTGKTPVVIMTANLLKKAGLSVAIVSRGYKRQSKGPLIVSDGSDILVSYSEAGDEPHIIATSLTGVPVVVGENRYKAAMLAYEHFKPDIIILDDAMQHRKLYRDVDIITMDADNPIGSEYLLPRGLLRESQYSIRRAKAVVITRFCDEHDREKIVRMVQYYARNVPIFFSRYKATGLREPGTTVNIEIGAIRGRKIAALSNVANPVSFYRILESHDADIVFKHAKRDHHRYTADELEDIDKDSLKAGAGIMVMTAKDERNLPEDYEVKIIKKLVLDIEAVIVENIEKYLKIIAPKNYK